MQTSRSSTANPSSLHPRRAALQLILGVLEGRTSLDDQAAQKSGPLSGLSAPDRARAQRLADDTLRFLRTADQMLGPFLRLAPRLPIHCILRLATVELLAHESAAHGVVDDAVTLARESDPESRAPALVNAVLRNVSKLDRGKWLDTPPPRLPKALRKRLVAAYGGRQVEAMEHAHAAGARLDLTLRYPAEGRTALPDMATRLPTGSLRLAGTPKVSGLPGFEEGHWWVQDAAAALPVRMLAPQPGMRIADLCAAPGGKTLQLAAAGADVTAVDVSEARLNRLRENLARTGLTATIVAADVTTWEGGHFDAVLLDAPCSATGTIRRHPDLPYLRDMDKIGDVASLQARLIDCAANLLKPGATLIYATCSLLPEEGEAQVAPALARNPDLSQVSLGPALAAAGGDTKWLTQDGAVRTRPDFWQEFGGMDGFFIAALRKSADAENRA